MNIIEALQALKEGKKITVDNDCFPKGNYIYYDKNYVDEHGCFHLGKRQKEELGGRLISIRETLLKPTSTIFTKSLF